MHSITHGIRQKSRFSILTSQTALKSHSVLDIHYISHREQMVRVIETTSRFWKISTRGKLLKMRNKGGSAYPLLLGRENSKGRV